MKTRFTTFVLALLGVVAMTTCDSTETTTGPDEPPSGLRGLQGTVLTEFLFDRAPASINAASALTAASHTVFVIAADGGECADSTVHDWNPRHGRCTLGADLEVPILILAPDVELNGAGHRVVLPPGDVRPGVLTIGNDDIRIRNLEIAGPDAGILLVLVERWRVEKVTARSPFPLVGLGVSSGVVERSVFRDGVVFLEGSEYVVFDRVRTESDAPAPTLFLDGSSNIIVQRSEFHAPWGAQVIDTTHTLWDRVDFLYPSELIGLPLTPCINVGGQLDSTILWENTFRGCDLPAQIAGDGKGVLVFGNDFMEGGGLQIGTFPGEELTDVFLFDNRIDRGVPNGNFFREHALAVDDVGALFLGGNLFGDMPSGGAFLRAIDDSLILVNNDVRDNRGDGLTLELIPDDFVPFFNNIHGNHGSPVISDRDLSFSYYGVGNWWDTHGCPDCLDEFVVPSTSPYAIVDPNPLSHKQPHAPFTPGSGRRSRTGTTLPDVDTAAMYCLGKPSECPLSVFVDLDPIDTINFAVEAPEIALFFFSATPVPVD